MAKARILIVEDEVITAISLRRKLESLGYEVVATAATEAEARAKAAELWPDLVLMDIMLQGGGSGIDAARHIHEQFGIPIVYLTAYSDDDTLERAKAAEPFGYLLKPIKERDLHSTVEMALHKHRAEMKLKKREEQLREAQRLESVGQLAAGVAHDFNNLLTTIIGYTNLLQRDFKGDSIVSGNLGEIEKAGQRAASLTHQLLAFSRKQILQPRVLDLNEAILGLEISLRRLLGSGITLRTALAPNLGQIKADPNQLEEVILHLARNAREAMPFGGTLSIETANVELKANDPHPIGELAPGSYVALTISDDGNGMDEKTRERIFEPFFTTKEQGRGTGLGLSAIYGIIKQSGGHITVESEPGKGTTFRIYLRRIDEVRGDAGAKLSVAGTKREQETILVVEDEEMVRGLVRSVLEMKGYKVFEATRGSEAIAICEKHRGHINLLITDVVMPEMSGRELAEYAAGLCPRLRVVFMSGFTEDDVFQNRGFEQGQAFLQKPFTPDSLVRQVRAVLDA